MPNRFSHGYALLIGVGTTHYPEWSLPLTVKDVQAIREVLVNPSLCAYPDTTDHVRVLHDAAATRQGILDGLTWLHQCAAADAASTVVVYYSGHGWREKTSNRDYYLIPHDVQPFDVPGSALAAEAFTAALRAIAAQRLVVFVDSCHAEGMAAPKDAAAAQDTPTSILPPQFSTATLPQGLIDDLAQGQGRAVFTSSRGEQRSWFHASGELSLYTYHLLQALQGAGSQPGDTVVKLADVMRYLGEAVPHSARRIGKEQTPFFKFETEDFPVALLLGGKGLPAGGWTAVQPVIPGITADHGSVAAQAIHAPVAVDHSIAAGGAVYNAGGNLVINKEAGPVNVGGIRAHTIEADNIVDGVLMQGGRPEDAVALVGLAQSIQRGGISADQIKAGNVVEGLHFIAGNAPTTTKELQAELAALREKVDQAIKAGEITDQGDAEDVQDALEKAEAELAKPEPRGARVIRSLKSAAEILTHVAGTLQAAGSVGVHILKLAPIAAALWKLAEAIF